MHALTMRKLNQFFFLPVFFCKILLSMIILIGSSLLVYAHLEAGEHKIIGEHTIDFGYSPKSPENGQKVALAFTLLNSTTQEVIEAQRVWIRISSKKDIVFSANLNPEAQQVAFIYIFPDAGDYEIESTFKNDDVVIAQAKFPITIKRAKYSYTIYAIIIVLAFIILMMAILLVKPKRKVRK